MRITKRIQIQRHLRDPRTSTSTPPPKLAQPNQNHAVIRAATTKTLVVAIAISLLTLLSATVGAQSPRNTENETVTHHVVLADKIIVEIDTTIDAEIKEARLWIWPHGRETIPSYSYVEFTQTDTIRATAEIDVQSPSYFPPGTIFNVRFEFISTDDEVYTSDTYHIEHIDNLHDWRRIADDSLEIIYYGINDRAIQNLHAKTAPILPEIAQALRVEDIPQFRAVIFPNVRELTIHGPTISQAATDGHYFGGFAYDQYNLTIMASPSAETLIHELTHLIFGRALDSPYATPAPAWLNEGHASYWETRERDPAIRRFRPIARSGRVTEFAAMNTVPGIRRDINNFYIQSTDFVSYLIETYGRDSIGHLLSELNAGNNVDDAMFAVYGGTLDQIENGWRKEWGLPQVASVEQHVDIETDLPPTIPGLPTIITGNLGTEKGQSSITIETQQSTEAVEPTQGQATEPAPQTLIPPQPQPTPEPQPTAVELTPLPTRTIHYITGSDSEWPQIKPSAIIVFLLLAAGVAAMMYRRLRV